MASKQLGLVLKINKDQEEARRAEYLKAQQYLLESQTKLTGLSDFRLDYMKQLHERGKQGLGSDKFNQFQ